MTDPETPDFSGLEGGEESQAADIVRDVVLWYSTRIAAERRAAVPDEELLKELKAGRQAALADQAQLATADPQEAARIAAVYAARLKELNKP
ncbi:hypothetical protein [Streptomyces sp. ML-6]|uniref:hypothetical protein n=1 Tax=Streptomyces sp. ML-6 TaxID=2982693 RepID=UPI0024BFE0CB|nr:hypothetical protein [Streptomyces sp. ML-6]MDK0524870.1 hypothetical protein [Streptomyces sp. ML-6]